MVASREAAGPQERDPATETGVGYITGSTLKAGHLARLFTTIHVYWTTSFFSDIFKIPRESLSVNWQTNRGTGGRQRRNRTRRGGRAVPIAFRDKSSSADRRH